MMYFKYQSINASSSMQTTQQYGWYLLQMMAVLAGGFSMPFACTSSPRCAEHGVSLLQGHTGRVSCLALSPSGRLLASGQITYLGFTAGELSCSSASGKWAAAHSACQHPASSCWRSSNCTGWLCKF
jgi:hypothetical protein